ncbi:hypothetical protein X961_5840 [Burkholderia pseudomallei MSHR5613]|nr:hypothetical protein X961_5840 [Burkholderia pseudomallei MSHR5613]
MPTCSNGQLRQSRMRSISCLRSVTRTSFCGKHVDCFICCADLIRAMVSMVWGEVASDFFICVSRRATNCCSTTTSQQLSQD